MSTLNLALRCANNAAEELLSALREAYKHGNPLECYALLQRIEAAAALKADLHGLTAAINDAGAA